MTKTSLQEIEHLEERMVKMAQKIAELEKKLELTKDERGALVVVNKIESRVIGLERKFDQTIRAAENLAKGGDNWYWEYG